ncbi:hypothetical protein TNCV_590281 [Trichonephila clavipes]|nr:hypothetical protein TNCV_590281 [Trichonephila clavipes]
MPYVDEKGHFQRRQSLLETVTDSCTHSSTTQTEKWLSISAQTCIKVSESSSLITFVMRCFSFTGSTGRGGTETLSFTYPHMKKSRSQDFWMPLGMWHAVVHDSSNPPVRVMYIEIILKVGQPLC